MIKLVYICIGLLIGLLFGYFEGARRTFQSQYRAFQRMNLAAGETRSHEAYQSQPRVIAIWELKHLVDLLEEAKRAGFEGPNSLDLKLFLAHGRLSRLFHLENQKDQALIHYSSATNYYNPGRVKVGYPNAQLLDFPSMVERIEQFDAREKVVPNQTK